MITIPMQINAKEFSLFVVLQDDNLDRIKEYDPAEVTIHKMGEPWTSLRLRDVVIGYATEAEIKFATEDATEQKTHEFLKNMSRGFRYRPDRGDHDGSYESMRRR